MGLWLKQSTAITVKIGPFIDDTDGKTAEIALTLTQADIRLSKNGANIAQKNEASAATTDELGYYDCPIDATDTNTLGILQLFVHETGALPVFHEYMVLPANIYDSLVSGSGTDYLQVDAVQLGGVTQSATDLKDLADTGYDPATHKVQGVVLCDTTTTNTDMITSATVNTAVDDALNTAIPAVNTADSVNDLLLDNLKGESDSILADTNELQTDWANGGRLDLLLDAAKEAVDTEVVAIKAITDTLTLTAIADAVLDEVTEGTTTLRHVAKLISSALFAKTSGGGTNTLIARDIGDTKPRITLTVDADGNRTASVLDGA